MIKDGISRTSRLLTLYHLFANSREVEIGEMVPAVSEEVFFADVDFLKNAGLIDRDSTYNKETHAFPGYCGWGNTPFEANYPEDETERAYMEKIRRLCILLNNLEWYDYEEKPLYIDQYKELFPDESDETRDQDFEELAKLGIVPTRHLEEDDDGNEIWVYALETPGDAYDLDTIKDFELPGGTTD